MSTTLQTLDVGSARIIKRKHPWRWVAAVIIIWLLVLAVFSATTNERFGWAVVGKYMFSGPILAGLMITLQLTFFGMLAALVLGWVVAVMRLSKNPVLTSSAWAFAWFFRATPLLVQLIFWYNIAALYPAISIPIPFGDAIPVDTNKLIPGYTAALIALSLHQAAYMSEIIRSGIMSVDEGQREAADALGLSHARALRLIVFPQAMRVIIPPLGNETIGLLKTTSLVSVVAVADLLYSTQLVYARTFQTIPMLIMASLWYLALTSILGIGQYYLERHFGRGATRNRPLTPLQRLRRQLSGVAARAQSHSERHQK
ncbi:amino acid ABC transporter permease [Paenarthrobacter nicotinovorans]|uniref:amino acid ABC transporter permease n=1 Tax=Paenarthrobacter nicotinovorans TaxID=29320 RepID=UPI003822A8E6